MMANITTQMQEITIAVSQCERKLKRSLPINLDGSCMTCSLPMAIAVPTDTKKKSSEPIDCIVDVLGRDGLDPRGISVNVVVEPSELEAENPNKGKAR